MKKLSFVFFIFTVALINACSSATAPNGNSANNPNANGQTNVPPEFSTKPVTPSGNSTPGIPDPNSANVNIMNKGATPTPGIPDPKTVGKTPVPKGATPTPGIPSPEEIKRQMNRVYNANVVNQIPKDEKELEKTINEGVKTVRKKP